MREKKRMCKPGDIFDHGQGNPPEGHICAGCDFEGDACSIEVCPANN